MIPYGRQDISQSDIDAVIQVLQSDFLTQGPVVPRFEEAVVGYCQVKYGLATNSATSALHIACLALGVGDGDFVWTSPITFVASSNCALYCNAKVDFVDIDSSTGNMSPEKLRRKLVEAKANNCLPKVVIPVHLCGQSCDMEAIHSLGQEFGFKIIEDASHAIGGKYKNKPVGNCRYSDITIFSFHPVKIITSGEGGMAVTNDPDIYRLLQLYRSHGVTTDPSEMSPRPAGEIWNYQQIKLGFNYRMTDIHAALGLSQLSRLDEFVERRHEIVRRYVQAFDVMNVTTLNQIPDAYSSYHLFPIRINPDKCGRTQREVYESFRDDGILVNLHYIPVHRQPYYASMGFTEGYCASAEQYFREAISLPVYTQFDEADQDRVIHKLKETLD